MNIYCPHCGQKTSFSGVKPVKCEFCSEPFIRKITPSKPVTARKAIQQQYEEFEETQADIPTEFGIRTNGPRRQKITIGSLQKDKDISLDRDVDRTGLADVDAQLSKAQQEALKNMINPGIQR